KKKKRKYSQNKIRPTDKNELKNKVCLKSEQHEIFSVPDSVEWAKLPYIKIRNFFKNRYRMLTAEIMRILNDAILLTLQIHKFFKICLTAEQNFILNFGIKSQNLLIFYPEPIF
ncbi:hypothetical protein BpHYR1_005364, partial [Brachionus plicatilis]